MGDAKPSVFLTGSAEEPWFREYPFLMLMRLKQTLQSPKYHPEGSVWNHTLLVLDAAAQMKDQSENVQVFMWAALLHDIGKPGTTRNHKERITSYNHEKLGAELSAQFLSEFDCDAEFIRQVSSLVRWHMQILFVNKSLPFADIQSMKRQTSVHEVALLGLCDRIGRSGADIAKEQLNIQIFLQKTKS